MYEYSISCSFLSLHFSRFRCERDNVAPTRRHALNVRLSNAGKYLSSQKLRSGRPCLGQGRSAHNRRSSSTPASISTRLLSFSLTCVLRRPLPQRQHECLDRGICARVRRSRGWKFQGEVLFRATRSATEGRGVPRASTGNVLVVPRTCTQSGVKSILEPGHDLALQQKPRKPANRRVFP